jgi:5-epi-alpha-selinene synthase
VRGAAALERLAAIGCGSCAAYTYPEGPNEVVRLGARLIAWLFLFDDGVGEGGADRDMRSLMARLATYEGVLRTGRMPADATPFHRALGDLRADALSMGGPEWLERFADSMARYFDGCVLEMPYRRAGTCPTIEEYRKLRSWSIGTLPVFDLIELRQPRPLTAAEAESPALAELRELAALLCAWVNDVYSYAKETKDSDPLNLVAVIAGQYRLSITEAFGAAAEIFNADMEDFDLRSSELAVAASSSDALRAYVRGLADWVHGNTAWTGVSRRY